MKHHVLRRIHTLSGVRQRASGELLLASGIWCPASGNLASGIRQFGFRYPNSDGPAIFWQENGTAAWESEKMTSSGARMPDNLPDQKSKNRLFFGCWMPDEHNIFISTPMSSIEC
uniref:Uncharacterized protein n=1 Tax=Romanomermis culicivorax TaxID=13658 RepID=A0A915IM12_ROMCU